MVFKLFLLINYASVSILMFSYFLFLFFAIWIFFTWREVPGIEPWAFCTLALTYSLIIIS